MMDIKNDIHALIKGAESAEVEFKSARGGLPESFWESFSAFANTNGGIIVLGVKEKEGRFLLDGLTEEQITLYKKRFWDCAHNKEKVSATMLTERDVAVGEADGSFYLVFRIPRATYNVRPVYLTRNPFGNMQKDKEIPNEHLSQAVPSLSQAVLSLSQACPKLNQYTSEVIAEFIYALREKPQSILKLMEILGETNRTRFRNKILIPLMENGLIEPTIKEVPNSPKQLYRLCKQL